MDMREVNDLMDYWTDHPPTHVATRQVFGALGGRTGSSSSSVAGPSTTHVTTPEQLAATLGMDLGGSDGNG